MLPGPPSIHAFPLKPRHRNPLYLDSMVFYIRKRKLVPILETFHHILQHLGTIIS